VHDRFELIWFWLQDAGTVRWPLLLPMVAEVFESLIVCTVVRRNGIVLEEINVKRANVRRRGSLWTDARDCGW
jgi:hypothetical protein